MNRDVRTSLSLIIPAGSREWDPPIFGPLPADSRIYNIFADTYRVTVVLSVF